MKSQISKKDLVEKYMQQQEIRKIYLSKIPTVLQAHLYICSAIISAELGNYSSSNLLKKFNTTLIPKQFREAFKTLDKNQKLDYYVRQMSLIQVCFFRAKKLNEPIKENQEGNASEVPFKKTGIFVCEVYSRSFSIGIWKQKRLRLDRQNHLLYAEKDDRIKTYPMKDYLLRRSKNKDYYSFVLEAINSSPHEKSRTVHLGFKQYQKFNECLDELKNIYLAIEWQFISSSFDKHEMSSVKNMSLSYTFGVTPNSAKLQQKNSIAEDLFYQTDPIVKNNEQFISFPVIGEEQNISKSMLMGNEISGVVFIENEERVHPADLAYTSLETIDNNLSFFDRMDQNFGEDNSKRGQQKAGKITYLKKNKSDNYEKNLAENLQMNLMDIQKNEKTLIQSIACLDSELVDEITDREDYKFQKVKSSNYKDNIFKKLVPFYDLTSLDCTVNYGTLFNQGNLSILGHLQRPNQIKVFVELPHSIRQQEVLNILIGQQLVKKCFSEVQELNLKTLIKSQNSAMMYMKLKQYNRLYRPRDFVFFRHLFKYRDTYYMIDKSIQNINYPPFTTIVRGTLKIIWGVKKTVNKTLLIADIDINHEGYLNESQNLNLTMKYVKCLIKLEQTMSGNGEALQNINVFSQNWVIKGIQDEEIIMNKQIQRSNKKIQQYQRIIQQKNAQFQKLKENKHHWKEQIKQKREDSQQFIINKNSKARKEEQNGFRPENKSETNILPLESPFKISLDAQSNDLGQIDEKQLQKMEEDRELTTLKIRREKNEEGYVVISDKYISKRHVLSPLPKQKPENQKYLQMVNGEHPLWKGEWVRDKEEGALIFTNEKKIADQKGVLTFIISQIGKNIFSGKSVMSISLPVDIFLAESNLELLSFSLSYSAMFLEPAAMTRDPIEKIKSLAIFGLNCSPLYLRIQKPFNPILGETFQAWIDGCPIYAEQISHHPPIAAFYVVGRGYRISAQLESKIQLSVNSGCGVNQGTFKVNFEDGVEGCCNTPGGELSGLTFGIRKFNVIGRAYYWIESQCLMLEIVFNPSGKGFFSIGKQSQPLDYYQGYIVKVKPEFFASFKKKKRGPTDKQIVQRYGKINGIWNQFMKYDDEIIHRIQSQFPHVMEYESDPLPSDSNWREDIEYRRLGQTSRAQTEKERLEIFQRHDRKLREKNNKKK